jgi:hypothetical protein
MARATHIPVAEVQHLAQLPPRDVGDQTHERHASQRPVPPMVAEEDELQVGQRLPSAPLGSNGTIAHPSKLAHEPGEGLVAHHGSLHGGVETEVRLLVLLPLGVLKQRAVENDDVGQRLVAQVVVGLEGLHDVVVLEICVGGPGTLGQGLQATPKQFSTSALAQTLNVRKRQAQNTLKKAVFGGVV